MRGLQRQPLRSRRYSQARFIDRIGKGIRGAPRDALVADLSPPELRGASFGLRQSLDTVGAFIGPALAILLMLITADNYQFIFWIAVIPAFAAVGILAGFVYEPRQDEGRTRLRFPLQRSEMIRLGKGYWLIVAIAAVFALARFSEAFLILRAETAGLPVAFAPIVLVGMNVVYALSAYPAGALSDRVDRLSILALGLGVLMAADILLAASSHLAVVAGGITLWGLHMGLTQGLLAAFVADTPPTDLRGSAFGVFNLVNGIALLGASLGAGLLWDELGAPATFLAGAIVSGVALTAVLSIRRSYPGRTSHQMHRDVRGSD